MNRQDYYKTANLKHLSSKIVNLEKKLKEYLITDDYLSYEFLGINRDFIFITGFNEMEKELIPFDHPLLLDGIMNKKYIVVDLRKYVKGLDAKPNTLKEVFNNSSYAMFQIHRAILLDMYLATDNYKLSIVQENIGMVYSNIISSAVNALIRLNPNEKTLVEGVCYIYVLRLFNPDFNNDQMLEYSKTMLRKAKLSVPLHVDDINDLLKIVVTADTFIECFENIKYVLKEKSAGLQLKVLYNTLANIWYGPGTFETVLLSLEDVPTMITLYLTAYNDTTFRKSRISNNVEVIKRRLDKEAFKKIEVRIKEEYNA